MLIDFLGCSRKLTEYFQGVKRISSLTYYLQKMWLAWNVSKRFKLFFFFNTVEQTAQIRPRLQNSMTKIVSAKHTVLPCSVTYRVMSTYILDWDDSIEYWDKITYSISREKRNKWRTVCFSYFPLISVYLMQLNWAKSFSDHLIDLTSVVRDTA